MRTAIDLNQIAGYRKIKFLLIFFCFRFIYDKRSESGLMLCRRSFYLKARGRFAIISFDFNPQTILAIPQRFANYTDSRRKCQYDLLILSVFLPYVIFQKIMSYILMDKMFLNHYFFVIFDNCVFRFFTFLLRKGIYSPVENSAVFRPI